MTERTAHGNAKAHGAYVVQETSPIDEQLPPQAVEADPLVTGRDAAKRVRTRAAAQALARLPRTPRNVPRKVACHPDFAAHDARRVNWTSKRGSELHTAHGGVSHGTGARVEMAGWLYASAEFCAEQAAKTLDKDWFKLLAQLAPSAKTMDDAGWEICAKEAIVRAKNKGTKNPWIGGDE